ncbi:hypothetical protein [Streptococcus ruminantium]|uniref:hypothetical protein n=1 Tax=Streptococcus ruminantium TaxID=1917441 RepID=UPI0012DE84FC|nr:hypothetical protein [Streptococcus ruminantium]
MIIDQQYKWLAEQVYWVDNGKKDVQYHPAEGDKYKYKYDDRMPELGQFKVLKVEDNPTNGMQAMVATMMEVRL